LYSFSEACFVRRLIGLLLLVVPAVSHAWWNDEWNFRKEVTLDLSAAGANIAGTPIEVPVLIKLHLGNFNYFGDTKPDGSDLRFIAGDDKTPLKFHVERYDPVTQLAYLWVKVPRLAGGTATEKIFLYYGNEKAPAAGDAAGSYDTSQSLVYHFAEEAPAPLDSTAYKNSAATSTAERNPASLIGAGLKFGGTSVVTVPSTATLRLVPAEGATLSAWVRVEGPQTDAYVVALQDANNLLALGISGLQAVARAGAQATPVTVPSTATLTTGQWHHLALTFSTGQLKLYLDGIEAGTAPAEVPEIAGTLTIGGNAIGGNALNGEVDEVQVARTARSADWLQAAARGQGQLAPLVVYGADAQREGGDVSYFAVTMRNVTIDGWVVIIILAVMFVISLIIMIGKAIFLARVNGANRMFLREFQKLKGDPTALDKNESDDDEGDEALSRSPFMPAMDGKDNKFRLSMLYRLYHHGVQEMTGRIGLQTVSAGAVTTLSPQAIAAIRATMDATQVRLTQKLQAQMVLLTIAISGGPFLGLLGTVVGVMITFAAIAASGDVNVNSIAPGIAAALAATVAGLAVAIPALFGYNWLNTKIKEISADMRVFIDEFVTRIAEHYS
jgi:biopolymer transport protein ExbB